MSNKYNKNRHIFGKQHYEIIAARFREELSFHIESESQQKSPFKAASRRALADLAIRMADRFQEDSDSFARAIFLRRCTPDPEMFDILAYDELRKLEVKNLES